MNYKLYNTSSVPLLHFVCYFTYMYFWSSYCKGPPWSWLYGSYIYRWIYIYTMYIYNECKSNQNYILNCSPFPPFSDISHMMCDISQKGGGAIQDLILIELNQCLSTLKLKVSVTGRRLMAMDYIPPPTLPFW